jgi:hypothetical protein
MMLISKSKRNQKFYNLLESGGDLKIHNRNFCNNFEFGDCFLFENKNEGYLLIVTNSNNDEFVHFQVAKTKEIQNFNIDSIRKISILYYSRKPILFDYFFKSVIPFGGFEIFFKRENLEISTKLIKDIRYLFSINLDKHKVMDFGGTSFGSDSFIQEVIEHSLNFEEIYKRNKRIISLSIPLENLCLE